MTPPIGSNIGNKPAPLIRVPAKNGFDLDLGSMKPIDGKDGAYTVKDTTGKKYIVNTSGTVKNSTVEGSKYTQTSNNAAGVKVGVSIYDGKDLNKDGLPDDSTEIFGGSFTYNGKDEKLTQDGNDDAKIATAKNLTSYVLKNGGHIAGFNTYTSEVQANQPGKQEVHSTADTVTVAQAPAERNAMEQVLVSGKPVEQTSQIFKLPVK